MNLNIFTVFMSVASLLLLGVPTYFFRKKNIIGPNSSVPFVKLLIFIAQPFLIFTRFQKIDEVVLVDFFTIIGFGAVIHILMILLVKFIFRFVKAENKQKGALSFCAVFSNCGYIGIPVISSIFRGSPDLPLMLLYLTAYLVVFNVANWTYGIYLISGDKKYISFKKAFLNPVVIVVAIGAVFLLLGFKISDYSPQIADTFDILGDLTTPLSLMIIGIKLAETKFSKIFNTPIVYLSVFIKLIIMPIIMLILLKLFPVSAPMANVLFLLAAMPTATISVANAEQFGGDAETSVKCLLSTTLLCVFTLPLLALFL